MRGARADRAPNHIFFWNVRSPVAQINPITILSAVELILNVPLWMSLVHGITIAGPYDSTMAKKYRVHTSSPEFSAKAEL